MRNVVRKRARWLERRRVHHLVLCTQGVSDDDSRILTFDSCLDVSPISDFLPPYHYSVTNRCGGSEQRINVELSDVSVSDTHASGLFPSPCGVSLKNGVDQMLIGSSVCVKKGRRILLAIKSEDCHNSSPSESESS